MSKRTTFFPSAEHPLNVCTRTVMDTTDPDIQFDADGVCNWWHEFQFISNRRPDPTALAKLLDQTIDKIRTSNRKGEYDCILGLSGGVDSSYMAYLAKKWDLRPLVVHFDNGWNNELAVHNIERMLSSLGFPLRTFVMDWTEFRDLQRSYFQASVLDLEIPTDHMIFGALHQIAHKEGIKYILSGNNFVTEWLLPRAWYYSKFDIVNLVNIHKRFGMVPLKKLPKLGAWQRTFYNSLRGIEDVKILEFMPYKKMEAKKLLMETFDWKDYGGKHYESIFTRFYQGYILPRRYGIDKRKAHLSNLICNNEITREEALKELEDPTYDPMIQQQDKVYVAKKLGWSDEEFESILSMTPVPHETYGTDVKSLARLEYIRSAFGWTAKTVRKLTGV